MMLSIVASIALWFRHLSIPRKLACGFGVSLLSVLALGVVTLVEMRSVVNATREINSTWLPASNNASAMLTDLIELRAKEYKYALSASISSPEVQRSFEAEMDVVLQRYRTHERRYAPLISSVEERRLYVAVSELLREYLRLNLLFRQLMRSGQVYAAKQLLFGSSLGQFSQMRGQFEQIIELNTAGAARAVERSEGVFARLFVLVPAVLLVGLVLVVALSVVLVRLIVVPLRRLEVAAELVAAGNVEHLVEVTTFDETGSLTLSFNTMVRALRNALNESKANTEQLERYVNMLSDANAKIQYQMQLQERQSLQHKIFNAELNEKNEQLRLALQQLKDAEAQIVKSERLSAMGILTAGVMHEVNNPNAVVYAASNALLHKTRAAREYFLALLDEEDRITPAAEGMVAILNDIERNVKITTEGSERVKTIVAKLQNFSKHQRGGTERKLLLEEFRSTVDLFRFQFKDVRVDTETGEDVMIEANFGELNQVFLNLLINAAQAGATSVNVNMQHRTSKQGKPEVLVTVADNGSGMPPDVIKQLFEPFYTTKGVGNTGLGLSISQGVIEGHGGTLTVQSQVGRGSVFAITLPVSQPASQAAAVLSH